LFDIAAMTLASYDLLARVLEESSDELPLAFKSFDADRLRQLVDIIAPHIHAFAESSRRSPS